VRVDGEDELGDELGGTPTPMTMPKPGTAAHAAYAAGRDKRKRKVGFGLLSIGFRVPVGRTAEVQQQRWRLGNYSVVMSS
jgi:hypothetical protein